MTETLDRLIALGVQAQMKISNPTSSVTYGVWIPGKGWLKNDSGAKCFVDARIEMADSAAQLYGCGAYVIPCDDSMKDLEAIFLLKEAERLGRRWSARLNGWMKRHGLAR